MLDNLLRGVEPFSSILIQDSLGTSGSGVLRAFIHENVTRLSNHNIGLHVLCFESPPIIMKTQLKLDNSASHIEFYDYCTDHRGWVKTSTTSASEVTYDLLSVKLDKKSRNVIVVDSLSTLIFRIGFHETYLQLHQLIQDDVLLLCLVHEDFLPDCSVSIMKLRHLFATCLQVVPSVNSSDNLVVVSTHVKKGGKVLRGNEECSVDADNNVTVHKIEDIKKKDIGKAVKVDTIPKELTTFKLDLGDNEKVARNKLVLPYLRPEGGGGKVFYEPDDADDWDEEDPDDDLDV